MFSENSRPAESSAARFRTAVLSYVRRTVARVAGVPVDGPDGLRDLDMDSVTRLNVTLAFERDLGELPAALLYEHLTVEDLADHFIDTHDAALRELLSVTEDASQPPQEQPSVVPGPVPSAEDIAVVGLTGRYPGAPDIESLWRNLRDGVVSITEVPPDRWDWREYFDARRGRPDKSYGRWGGFIDGVADFDAEFFGILPSDAVDIDPQERLFLHVCWDLLEQAGCLGPTTHQPATGVFVGTMNDTYGRMGAAEWPQGKLTGANSAPWAIANRVSYVFDFHGPSFAVDSACSSSLVAVHLACESLRRGECAAAIAGGVNLILHPSHLVGLAATGMLASGEASKVFDAAADGYIPGEGVGAVLLKPLATALADNDRIWGVIKAGALNAAGRTSGFAVPNPAAQADLVTVAIGRAGLAPHTISYVEAHGTGTKLGDPIEMTGLARALAPGRSQPCAVGSVKANIGHLEGAAGIAGLTKVLLQMKYRQIAPCANLDTVNPKISDTPSVLDFPRALTPWPIPEADSPRYAGVSSFGAGGANAHLIVAEFPTGAAPVDTGGPAVEQVVLLSARNREQLRTLAAMLAKDISSHGAEAGYPERLAWSTQIGRREMRDRLAVPFTDLTELRAALEDFATGRETAAVLAGSVLPNDRRNRHPDDDDDDDEDDRAYLDVLIEKRRVRKLARLWVDGAAVDWSRLWTGWSPRRVDLPPYPFTMKRYWSPSGPASVRRAEEVPAAPVNSDGDLRAAVEGDLRMAACGFLLVDPDEVDIDGDLMELGFDSVSLVELMIQMDETFGIELDVSVVLDHPTLRAIAGYLVREHPDAVAKRHDESASGPAR